MDVNTAEPIGGQLPKGSRTLLVVSGSLLLVLAAAFNYGGTAFAVRNRQITIGLADRTLSLSAWWVLIAILVMAVGIALSLRPVRRALAMPSPGRSATLAVAAVLTLFGFTLFPWEYHNTFSLDTGSTTVLYLLLSTAGFAFLVTGLYPRLGFLDRPVQRAYRAMMAMDRRVFMLATFGCMFAVANAISFFTFEHMPHVQDSISQVFQARIFAAGRLRLLSPKFPDFFDYTHIINNGWWYSQYAFLHSLLLVLPVMLGISWIVNPLLGALTAPAIYLLGREVYDERTGRIGAVLACVSPFIFNMSAEYMNHAGALLFFVLFMLFFFRTQRRGRWQDALVAGVFLGLMANVRLYTAIAVALPFGIYVYLTSRDPRASLRRFLPMLGSLAVVGSLIFVYNWLVNGDPLLFGYVVKWGAGHEVGFGKSGWGPGHTPLRGLVNTGNNLNGLNRYLFEWPIPCLLPLVILLLSGTADKRDWLLFSSFAFLVGAYFFYWYQDLSFGPRMLYEVSAGLILLTVRSGTALGPFLERLFRVETSGQKVGRLTGRVVLLMFGFTLVCGLPPLYLHKYKSYFGVDARLVSNVRRQGLKNALVFCGELGSAFNANSLTLDGDVVYARNYGMFNAALTLAYPERDCYYANRDTLIRLHDIDYQDSRLAYILAEMAAALSDTLALREQYYTLIWPFIDNPPAGLDPERLGVEFTDFRKVSAEIFAGERTFPDYTPALACWVVGDDRAHLKLFHMMNSLQHFIIENFKFTIVHVTEGGKGAVYDIRRVTGEERTVDRHGNPLN